MSIRTTRAGALALCLAMHLLGSPAPAMVLCIHHGGDVAIERADHGAVRCDHAHTPCVPVGLAAGPDQDHCHDVAIAQPGLGERAPAAAASAAPIVVVRVEPARSAGGGWAIERRDGVGGSPPQPRRTIVLRI
jgi:hypothetical protein